jgi:hypothetical protein
LEILGSAAVRAAMAAFLALVLLICSVLLGIHAPDRHAMPRTQNSGQARTLKYSSGNARVEGVLTLNGKALYCRRSLFFGSTQCLTGAPMVQATVTIMSVPTIFGQQDVPSLIKDERGTFFSLTRGQVVQSWLRLSVLHAVLLSFVPSVILPILFARKQR